MPPGPRPPLPAGIGRIAISGVASQCEWANIFHVRSSGPGGATQADWDNVVEAFVDAYETNLMPLHSTASTCQEGKGVYITSPGNELISVQTSSQAGGEAGALQPGQVSIGISWQISAYYRGGHPRTYIPAISTNWLNDNKNITAAAVTAFNAGAAAFLTAVNAITFGAFTTITLGTLSFARANAWLVSPAFYPINGGVTHKRIDTQRRRLGKEVI